MPPQLKSWGGGGGGGGGSSPHLPPPMSYEFSCTCDSYNLCSYQSYPGDPPAHLTAGVAVTPEVATPVTDENVLNLLPAKAVDSIVQVSIQC